MKFFPLNTKGSGKRHERFFHRYSVLRLLMRMSFFYIPIMVCSLQMLANTGKSQGLEDISVTAELNNEKLEVLFNTIHEQTGLLFTYFPEQVDACTGIVLPKATRSVKATLDLALNNTPLTYRHVNNNIIILQWKVTGEEASIRPAIPALTMAPQNYPMATVTGTVTDAATQQPMPGVNVIVKGTMRGTSTDSNGRFTIQAEHDDVLVFTFIGFKTFEAQVNARSVIDVTMEVDVNSLKEVVVNAGYYDVKDREKTGSISKVSSEIIEDQPVTNPLQAMQGRMPGIYISQFSGVPGSNFQVRIRGANSLASGNNPLYIIDGVPFISETLSSDIVGQSLYGKQLDQGDYSASGISPLNSINPNDIESIEVLKDADATAIYGSRGANGVILITTKRGKPDAVKVDVNVRTGVSKVTRKVPMQNTEQYIAMRMEALHNDGDSAPKSDEYDINGTWDQNRYTDWQEVLIGGSAKMTDMNTSVSAGNNETQFLFSAGYNDQGTVFPGNNSAGRFSTHFSVSHKTPDKKFSTSFSTSYIINNSNILNTDLTTDALSLAPNAPKLYDENGNLNWENSTWRNPLAYLVNRVTDKTHNLIMTAELGHEVAKGLRVKSSFGINEIRKAQQETNLSTSYKPSSRYTPGTHSQLQTATNTSQSWIIEPQVNWERKVSNGKLSVLMGGTFQNRVSETSQQKFIGFPNNALVSNPTSATIREAFLTGYSEYKYAAIYGRINYSWNAKYFLNLTGRRDGSSRFGPGRKFANLGAIGLAWIFSSEAFIKNTMPFLSFGKIRGSYGLTGNDQIGDYQYLQTYGARGAQYQGIGVVGPSRLFNPDFGWEVNKKLEGAIELGFLNDCILLTAAWYLNRSSNQLVDYQLSGTSGYTSVLQNSPATVENTGIELELTTVNTNKGYFRWTSSLNMTFPKNRLVAFPNLESSSYANTYVIGKPLNIYKAYHYLGVDPATGLYQIEDINDDGQFTSEDRRSVWEFGQDYYGGINNSFSFKGLQVDVFFQFVYQNGRLFTYDFAGGVVASNRPRNVFDDRWQEPGDQAIKQRFSRSEAAIQSFSQFTQSDAVAGGWYLIRLKNISISYQVPDKIMPAMKSRLYVQGQNLLTFTDYTGLNPETGGYQLPPLTTFVAGLQLTF